MKKEAETTVERLKEEQRELNRQIAAYQEQVEQIQGELQSKNAERRALERKVFSLEADVHSARGQAETRVQALQEELDRCNEIMAKQEALIRELREHDGKQGQENVPKEGCQSVEIPSLGEFLERLHHLETTNRRLQLERRTLLEAAQSARVLTERLRTAEVRLEQYRQRLESQTSASSTFPPNTSTAEIPATTLISVDSNRQMRQLTERTAELVKAREALGRVEAEKQQLEVEIRGFKEQIARLGTDIKELRADNSGLREQHLGCASQEGILRSELGLLKERLEAAERTESATRDLLLKIKVHPKAMEE